MQIANKHLEIFGMLDGLLNQQPSPPNSKTTMMHKVIKKEEQLFIRADRLLYVIDDEVVIFLKEDGLLLNAGTPKKMELAGKRVDWLGINYSELKRRAAIGSLKGYHEFVASLKLPCEPARDFGGHSHIAIRAVEVYKANREKVASFTP